MTVRELISVTTCGILITGGEDPNNEIPEIEIPACCTDECWWLSDDVLDHKIHLMTVKNGSVYVSLFINGDTEDDT